MIYLAVNVFGGPWHNNVWELLVLDRKGKLFNSKSRQVATVKWIIQRVNQMHIMPGLCLLIMTLIPGHGSALYTVLTVLGAKHPLAPRGNRSDDISCPRNLNKPLLECWQLRIQIVRKVWIGLFIFFLLLNLPMIMYLYLPRSANLWSSSLPMKR